MSEQVDLQWLQNELQPFLNTTLKPIIPNKKDRDRYYLNGDAMNVWVDAFTHETVSLDRNYEDLEFLGDAILKAVFPLYLMNRFPDYHKGELTELNVYYMSKMQQAALTRKIGLQDYARIVYYEGREILNVQTDLFESFFGALYTLSDRRQFGLGFSICYSMIVYLFKDIKIDEERIKGSSKTQVEQIFSRFALPKYETFVEDVPNKNMKKFTVVLVKEQTDFLRKNAGVDAGGEDVIIGEGYGKTKREASNHAFDQALSTLELAGVTKEWAEKTKHKLDFEAPEVAVNVRKAMERARRAGFYTFKFFVSRKTTTEEGAIIQLIGEKEDGTRKVLVSTFTSKSDKSFVEAKAKLVAGYARGSTGLLK